jgi:serine protease Do
MQTKNSLKRSQPFILLMLLFWLPPGVPVTFAASHNTHIFPLPVIELESVISSHLKLSGFDVRRIRTKTGIITITASKVNQRWMIFLHPYSSLATEINAQFTVNDTPDKSGITRLKELIADYIQSDSEHKSSCKLPSAKIAESSQGIPYPVLSSIESVVCIHAEKNSKQIQSSGLVIGENGLILSTAHDLLKSQKITVTFSDGSTQSGVLIKIDYRLDLALISVDLKGCSFIPLAEGRNLLGMGERLYSIGCPKNQRGTIYSGVINGPPRRMDNLPFWQVDMAIYHGSSGSPVFDIQGNLVAVIKGKYKGTASIGFLIPLETVIDFVTGE